MSITVRSSAPCRADLAGGTLDIWPLGLLHDNSLTVNVALPVGVTLSLSDQGPEGTVQHRVADRPWQTLRPTDVSTDLTAATCFHFAPRGGLMVDVLEQAPIGSGLGGSSTYGIALAKAAAEITGNDMRDDNVVRLVQNLEARLLGIPTGCQDHWAALRGGLQALHLEVGGDRIERLSLDHDWLEARFTVFYTGITHHSGMVNWQVIRRRLEQDPETTRALQQISVAADRCRQALLEANDEAMADALRQEWTARQTLAPEVCPSELKRLEAVAFDAGAMAFKACGAGGGGSVLIWHEPSRANAIAEAMIAGAPGGMLFPRGVNRDGCTLE